jgi:hypothetical protein
MGADLRIDIKLEFLKKLDVLRLTPITKQNNADGRSCHQRVVLSLAQFSSTGILFLGKETG